MFRRTNLQRALPRLICMVLALAICVSLALSFRGQDEIEVLPAPVPIEVSVIQVTPAATRVDDELPGRVVAYRTAEIRPQVGGVIQGRLFEQGSEVHAGQPLFQIKPEPFRAAERSAAATLQRAQAALIRTQTHVRRLRPLVDADAISRQSYDDAVANWSQALADVAQAQADLQRKRLDVDFATVTSPISGRIDQAAATEGALATAGGADALATVQQIDQVYVDVRQPASRLDALRRITAGRADVDAAVTILDADGKPYPMCGRLLFSGVNVDAGTGEVIARVLVPNPARALLPGMFVRAQLPRLMLPQGISLPQQAIAHDDRGKSQVSVVDEHGRVHPREVTIGAERAGMAIVTAGLSAGDIVIVEGRDHVQPNTRVKTVPWHLAPMADKR